MLVCLGSQGEGEDGPEIELFQHHNGKSFHRKGYKVPGGTDACLFHLSFICALNSLLQLKCI